MEKDYVVMAAHTHEKERSFPCRPWVFLQEPSDSRLWKRLKTRNLMHHENE